MATSLSTAPSTNAGLTLIELLVAVSLMSGVLLAIAWWSKECSHSAVSQRNGTHWQIAADRLLEQISRDFLVGDFGDRPSDDGLPAWSVDGQVLEIATRDLERGTGRIRVHYEWDGVRNAVVRHQVGSPRGDVPALGGVKSWNLVWNKETEMLQVVIESMEAETRMRRWKK